MISIVKEDYSNYYCGKEVSLYTVSNGKMSFSATNFGCTITRIFVPDSKGNVENVVLGFDSVSDYLKINPCYFGVLAGRFANRIGKAQFKLEGVTYNLDKNDGENSLHGGYCGLHTNVFDVEIVEKSDDEKGLKFSYLSPNGEEGFPGNLKISVEYLLNSKNQLVINYFAVSDKATPLSLTNHSYFNLTGDAKADILNHELFMDSDKYLEVDGQLIPTGNLTDVTGNAFDFRKPKTIGKDVAQVKGGYDHCYCLKTDGKLTKVSECFEPVSGRKMTTLTTMPGVQLYTGGSLSKMTGYKGKEYDKFYGFCLETQQYPDAPNKPDFPSCIIEANKEVTSNTIYEFAW